MRKLALTILLLASPAQAVVYTETEITRFEMCARREAGGPPSGVVTIVTKDNSGEERTIQANVGAVLTAQEKTQMRTFLTTVVNRIYSERAIPTPTPAP